MPRPIRWNVHRALDYLTVVAWLALPPVLQLTRSATVVAWPLAAVQLAMTLATCFPGMRSRPIPFPLHLRLDMMIGVVLLILPWLMPWNDDARALYVTIGVVSLIVPPLTDPRPLPQPA